MSRNSESHFAQLPQIDVRRSIMNIDQDIKTSFNCGDVVPFYWAEVLPGSTHTIKTSKVVRLSTMQVPPMDSLYLDTYYFFVPYRLVWKHWVNLMGENTESAWIPETEYEVPYIETPEGGWNVGTIADYMGIPTGVDGLEVSALPFRAYAKIIDDWFRDENLQDPVNFPVDDTTVTGSNGSNYVSDLAKGGAPFVAAKFHDYFTSCLPGPLKHEDILLPLGASAPVYAGEDNFYPKEVHAMRYSFTNALGQHVNDGDAIDLYGVSDGTTDSRVTTSTYGKVVPEGEGTYIGFGVPLNLYADLSLATASTVNQLRMAFQLQKFYERQSISGSRYTEILKSMFGVTSPDARLQRSEYLGGNRIPIVVTTSVNNSGTTDAYPQANLAAWSQTVDSNGDFQKSFTEHGIILGLCVARYHNSYQQGLHRMWSRRKMEDFYWPLFQALGEQAVLNKEVYATGVTSGEHNDNDAFGYQERWAEYRYKPNQITGMLRSSYAQSLDVWHYGDDYAQLPVLSDTWIRTDKGNVDRSLVVSSEVSHQFIADIFVHDKATQPMPLYSVPGYIDHF